MPLQALIDDPGLPRVILVEVHPFDLGLAGEVILGFSTGADAPVYNGHLWHERIATSYSTNTTITQSGFDLGGFTTPTYGVITFKVGDGSSFTDSLGILKDLRTLSWDGRRVRMLMGSPKDNFAAFEVIFDGLIEDFTWNETDFTLSIRDKTTKLDDEMQIVTFAGTGGLEGGADVKNLIKPLVFGVRKNIVPILVDSLNQIYVINEGSIQAVDDVFDNAVELINAGDIVTLGLPALVNWTPEGGRYITDLAQGAIRVGAEPAGVLTMDVQGDNSGTGFVTKTADIIERILLTKGGFVAADIDSPSFTKFNTDFPGSAGTFIKDDITIRTVINDLLLNLNAFGITTPEGKVEIGIVDIDVPGLTVDATLPTVDSTLFTVDQTNDPDLIPDIFEDKDIINIVRQETANPVWKTQVGFKKIGRVQEIEDTEIPDNVASDPFNLLKGQLLVTQETGDFTYADKISLAIDLQQEVLPGDVLSIGLEVEDPTADVTSVRVQVLFFDAADAQVGSTVEGNFINTAATFIRSFIHSFTVPLTAAKITIQTFSATNGTDVLSRRVMLNRGTIALPFIPSSDFVSSDLVNLLRNQVLLTENIGDFTYANLIPLATAFQQEIRVGDTLSIGLEFKDPTANVTSLRVQVQFFTDVDAQVGATLEGNFITGAATFERSIIDNFDVPATAAKMTIKTRSTGNGADVLSRRLILNRGTLALDFIPSITDALNGDTILPPGVTQAEGASTHSLGIGLSVGTAADGEAVVFSVPWTSIPEVIPIGGALTNNDSITGDQELVFVPLNLTTTGFTASVKNQSLSGGSPTVVVSSVESTPTGTVDEQIDKSSAIEADNDQYTIFVNITVSAFEFNGDPPEPGNISIGFYSFKNGVGWTKRAEVNYFSSGTKSKTITVDGLNSTLDKWGVKRESSSPGNQSLNDIVQVTFSHGGTQTIESATPTGATKINFLVVGGAEGGT